MPRRAKQIFLERQRYRLRRIMDAVRLLPVIGVVLWMTPLLWPARGAPSADRVTTSEALLYIFAVWCALIAATALLWARLRTAPEDVDAPLDDAGAD